MREVGLVQRNLLASHF